MVPQAGLEPARPCRQQILSLPRLPFRHWGFPIEKPDHTEVRSRVNCRGGRKCVLAAEFKQPAVQITPSL